MSLQTASRQLLLGAPRRIAAAVAFSTATPLWSSEAPKPFASTLAVPQPNQQPTFIDAPRSYGKRVGAFTPQPLPRPIGMMEPPREGQNTGEDHRSLMQKRVDLTNWDKHLERREQLKSKIVRPYFRDWDNTKFHDGKSFIAPIRVFRADKSLYFPNLHGITLEKSGLNYDTTPVLTGKASVVALLSGRWAETQVNTWINEKNNPELHEVLKDHPDTQIVRVNFEDNAVKAWLIKLFMGNLRRTFPEADWGKYFIVRKGITDGIREHIGFLNSKVGYVYIVDQNCRIRWAGSGPAHPVENESLAKGLQRVVNELKQERVELALKKGNGLGC